MSEHKEREERDRAALAEFVYAVAVTVGAFVLGLTNAFQTWSSVLVPCVAVLFVVDLVENRYENWWTFVSLVVRSVALGVLTGVVATLLGLVVLEPWTPVAVFAAVYLAGYFFGQRLPVPKLETASQPVFARAPAHG